ncbi:aminotransferase class I/II-fold pyridoxal phosphate-dependent enzyme (plasmid) [Azospirillum argentinense]|uniref:Aminotransferase n=1 Tax=Azospirillum argentinense TaxID=2970906 RepID=A0A4D8PQP0_9PROT|nr:aminotransferase class I/II-fold pyridoxal phosphate-dependent enzyme [Azospirillum argentinense]QCO00273.1 aminotransferase class I/II-fold pyridoxal phosphate-dependent enzyme [Azospirillum argentinense]
MMSQGTAVRGGAMERAIAVDVANRILRIKETRPDLVLFHDGELDAGPAESVLEATKEALDHGRTRYDDLQGLKRLRERICELQLAPDGIAADPREILVGNGSSQVIFEIFQTLLEPGDEVIVPSPTWPTYGQGIRHAGGIPVPCRSLGSDLDVDAVRERITPATSMVVINTPHNPTGAVYSADALGRLLELTLRHDLFVLADEAYHGLLFDGRRHVSIRALAGAKGGHVLTTRSFSKAHAMTGFRVGYVHARADIIRSLADLHAHMTDNVCTFAQYGALRAVEDGAPFVEQIAAMLQQRRDAAIGRAHALFECVPPAGGFYLFPHVAPFLGHRFRDAVDFAERLMEEAGVAVLPGEAFGARGHVRIAFAGTPPDAIAEGFDRIAEFLQRA